MTPISGPVRTIVFNSGSLRFPLLGGAPVGDRLVPPVIEVELDGVDGQPALSMLVEVIDKVPRCTEISIKRSPNGREVREKDLRAVDLELWVETFVSWCSTELIEQDFATGEWSGTWPNNEDSLRRGINTIRDVRKGSRRRMTPARLQRVAVAYNAQTTGGIEAVQLAFGVSRSTAIRYVRYARAADLIETEE